MPLQGADPDDEKMSIRFIDLILRSKFGPHRTSSLGLNVFVFIAEMKDAP